MTALWQFVAEPFALPFMQRALAVAVIVGVMAAVMSCYLVLRGWSLMGDAVSHAVLPGLVLAEVAGLPLLIGAFVAGLFCAWAANWLRSNSRIKSDTVLGIVFSGMFALGLVLFTKIDSDQHLLHILFGDVLGVSVADLAQTLVVAALCLGFVLVRRRDLLLAGFDRGHAHALGLPVKLLDLAFLIVLSLVIVVALKAVGVILVVALLIGPGAIAFLLTKRFDHMLMVAVAAAVLSAGAGTLASYHLDAATGSTIVLALTGLFVLALLFAPGRGLLRSRGAAERKGDAALDAGTPLKN